jgi:hypothetical protein
MADSIQILAAAILAIHGGNELPEVIIEKIRELAAPAASTALTAEPAEPVEPVEPVTLVAPVVAMPVNTIHYTTGAAEKPKRTKQSAGRNEREDIRKIVAHIKAKSKQGLQLIDAFEARFGRTILDAREEALGEKRGNRKKHYDFEILLAATDGASEAWMRVEHKGSKDIVPISADQTPWSAGVQFHNGGCEKYKIALIYARLWYTQWIGSGVLKTKYDMITPIPTFEEWYEDVKTQACTPKTAFGKELKKKVRDQCDSSLLELRESVIAEFNPTDAEMDEFKAEVLQVLNAPLNEKDYWLTIHGDVDSNFYCAWYPKFTLQTIRAVVIRKEKDIFFDFDCDIHQMTCILRWGGGAGFTNLRIDAR